MKATEAQNEMAEKEKEKAEAKRHHLLESQKNMAHKAADMAKHEYQEQRAKLRQQRKGARTAAERKTKKSRRAVDEVYHKMIHSKDDAVRAVHEKNHKKLKVEEKRAKREERALMQGQEMAVKQANAGVKNRIGNLERSMKAKMANGGDPEGVNKIRKKLGKPKHTNTNPNPQPQPNLILPPLLTLIHPRSIASSRGSREESRGRNTESS